MSNFGTDIVSKTDKKVKFEKPKNYKIIILNDDFTTQEFVVMLLCEVFEKDFLTAIELMMDIHLKGQGLVGIYSKKIAEHLLQKANQYIIDYNQKEKSKQKENRHISPLQLKLEEE